MTEFQIRERWVGDEHPPLVIAEIGINHGGSLDVAIKMAESAISAGAEIIKHQTHIVDEEMSEEARRVIPGNADRSIYEIMEECALSESEERQLMDYVTDKGGIFISTPFSKAAVDRLVEFKIPAFKIGSGECNNYPLVRYVAQFGKPVILSTGMNTLESIRPSVEILRDADVPFGLLHCTNVYPTPPELVRLGAMQRLKESFSDAVVGLSDHTTSNYACLGAVALGAAILERHFTDDMGREGPDIACSMDPRALRDLIDGSGVIYLARGGEKEASRAELATMAFALSSVVATEDIQPGQRLTEANIWLKRPNTGDFGAPDYDGLLGAVATEWIRAGSQVRVSDIERK